MCGKSEVNFHYSSNINGCKTETHLCSECAAAAGYDVGQMFSAGNWFDDFFPVLSDHRGAMQSIMPVFGFGIPFQVAMRPRLAAQTQADASVCNCGCGNHAQKAQTEEVDDEMKKRRELYAAMRSAAENEDFEKAAQLRDQIKEMEKPENENTA